MKLVLQNDDCVEWVFHHLNLDWISHPTVREVIESRFSAMGEDWAGVAGWLSQLENASTRSLITEALADDRENSEGEKILKGDGRKQGLVQILRDKFYDRELAVLSQRLSQPNVSDAELTELNQMKLQFRYLKQQPLTPVADA